MPEPRPDRYLDQRRSFQPKDVQLAIVAESPPASGLYFYDPSGRVTEPLFSALMKQMGFAPSSKEMGLREFQRRGWVLVDATYEPVNKFGKAERNRVILRDYGALRDDLGSLLSSFPTPVVLLKANVCKLLEPRLREDGFNVINNGRPVYFPSNGQQREFDRQFREILTEGVYS